MEPAPGWAPREITFGLLRRTELAPRLGEGFGTPGRVAFPVEGPGPVERRLRLHRPVAAGERRDRRRGVDVVLGQLLHRPARRLTLRVGLHGLRLPRRRDALAAAGERGSLARSVVDAGFESANLILARRRKSRDGKKRGERARREKPGATHRPLP